MFKWYRRLISPFIHALAGAGSGCRFQPTCSEYCEEAVHKLGLVQGLFYGIKRVLKCHPFHPGGWDPIPVKNQHE